MGRIKTKRIKNLGDDIYSRYSDKISKDFEQNKNFLSRFVDFKSKKIRNVIAGYLTRKVKNEKI